MIPILIALTVVVLSIVLTRKDLKSKYGYRYDDALTARVVGLFLAPALFGVFWGIGMAAHEPDQDKWTATQVETSGLGALNNTDVSSSSWHGDVFLVFGSASGKTSTKRVINYLQDHGGHTYSLEQVGIDKALVHEGVKVPSMQVTSHTYAGQDWWWNLGYWYHYDAGFFAKTYQFNVPTGTVDKSFSIDNSK